MHSTKLIALIAANFAAAFWFGLVRSEAKGDERQGGSGPAAVLTAGVAQRDITPTDPMPMWGYGARHAALSEGVLEPLLAKALVIEANGNKLAVVALDLGRGPTPAMMERIRAGGAELGIGLVLACGSHTHHGPVIELTDREGFGRGAFDACVKYAQSLPEQILAAIAEADRRREPATLSVAAKETTLNRNRQSKRPTKTTDPVLTVVRIDQAGAAAGNSPLAVLVNFAAHPVMTPGQVLKFSPDYVGPLRQRVERQLGGECLFLQGAAGDMSPNSPPGIHGPEAFGHHLADHVCELAKAAQPLVRSTSTIAHRSERFQFATRIDLASPLLGMMFEHAFFPELVRNLLEDFRGGLTPELNTVLLNDDLAIVTGSGEFFSSHARRLRERTYVPHLLFLGYCNGHHMYFPTIEAVSEGGYGADFTVSPVEVGAGERMMDRALVSIYTLAGKISPEQIAPHALPGLDGSEKEPAAPALSGDSSRRRD